jgi:hypothetical protein
MVTLPGCHPPCLLYGAAYAKAIQQDMELVLRGFDAYVGELITAASAARDSPTATVTPAGNGAADVAASVAKPQAWLQLPAIGLGFFADLYSGTNIAHILRPRFLQGLEDALKACAADLKYLRVLELLDFIGSFKLPAASYGPVKILHSERKSLLKFDPATLDAYICGVVNAGDAFAFPGNERGYCSVEVGVSILEV